MRRMERGVTAIRPIVLSVPYTYAPYVPYVPYVTYVPYVPYVPSPYVPYVPSPYVPYVPYVPYISQNQQNGSPPQNNSRASTLAVVRAALPDIAARPRDR
ncbi:hypothetical protein J3R75_000901 [Oligosphaera ethanolica]|uniref:Uncharacterized protein n=1 Tax=Oligosphaera ethanolica TaxID=760260 RepID=A0AAE3VE13_9BACT|nr:hypothetical protein [Oligosphaera ethanolica]